MQRTLSQLSIGLVVTGSLLTACGGDQPTLTAAEFRTEANAICDVGGAEVHEAFFGVFDGDPTPESMQLALDTVIGVSNRQLDDIEALAAPADLTAQVDEFVAQGRVDTDEAAAMGLGFFESEDDPWAETSALALELGIDACGGG